MEITTETITTEVVPQRGAPVLDLAKHLRTAVLLDGVLTGLGINPEDRPGVATVAPDERILAEYKRVHRAFTGPDVLDAQGRATLMALLPSPRGINITEAKAAFEAIQRALSYEAKLLQDHIQREQQLEAAERLASALPTDGTSPAQFLAAFGSGGENFQGPAPEPMPEDRRQRAGYV